MSIFDKITERVGDFFDEVMLPEPVRRAHDEAAQKISAERYGDALAVLRPTLIEHPNIARTHHLIGMCHFHREEWGDAIAAFERSLSIKEVAASHFYAGLAAEKIGRWQDLQRHFSRALTLAEDLPFAFDLHYGLGRAYRELNRPDKALKELRSALKTWPGEFDATLTLAEALLDQDRVAEANDVLGTLSESRRPRFLLLRGRIDEKRGEYAAAQEAFEDAGRKEGPSQAASLLGAARNALRLNDDDAASDYLSRATAQTSGERCDVAVLRGRVAELRGDPASAEGAFEEALEIDRRRPEALLGMGRLKLAAGQMDEAAAKFVGVFTADDPALRQEAWWGAGRCHYEAGDLAGARHLFEQALEIGGPRSSDVLWSMGQTALRLGDAAEAVVFLRDALELAPPTRQPAVQATLDEALARLAPSWVLPDEMGDPERVIEVLDALQQYLGKDTRLSDFLAPTQRLHTAMSSPLSLAIVGEFNAGKSTIVNALVGEDVFPTGVLPTTAHTGILRWGPRKAARVIYDDGERSEQSLIQAKKTMKTDADRIERLEFTHPHPDLRLVHYWDTPGFNALEERHERVAAEALDTAEAILWVMDAGQVLSQTEFERIETLAFGEERLLVVINKIDRLGLPGSRQDDVEHLISYVRDNLAGRIAGVFAISALDATSDDEAVRGASGFDEFREFLEHRVIQRAGRIKTIEVGRQIEHLAFTLDAFQNGLIQRYASLEKQVGEIGSWLGTESAAIPERRSADEVATMSQWIEHALESVESEISDSLRPTSGWTGKLAITEEDREFILGLVAARFDRILETSYERTKQQLSDLEREIAEKIDPVVRSLSLGDARALQRRIDGFFDESRVLALLWEERIYGALRARAQGRIETTGGAVLSTIEAAQSDRTTWRSALHRLLPTLEADVGEQIRAWYSAFFEAAGRFCTRVQKDLQLLELEARTRYDVGPVMELVATHRDPDDAAQGEESE